MRIFYTLKKAPDFSLNKYSTLSETGPSGVLVQHASFWRLMNRWGKEFNGMIRFIYVYDPEKESGERLKVVIGFEAGKKMAIESIRQIMKASTLAPYYDGLEETDESCIDNRRYSWRMNAYKKERFITASNDEKDVFYTVSEWEMNDGARLYSLMKMMEAMNKPCIYCLNIYPVDIEENLNKGLIYILPHLRELNSFKVKSGANSFSSGGRDENAKKALDFYEDLEDAINNTPHFLVNIQAFGESEVDTRQILDALSSEALESGDNMLCGEAYDQSFQASFNEGFTYWGNPGDAEQLSFLPHLLTLEELVPFATFPVLYPGESIEMLKETAPDAEDGLYLGKDLDGHSTYYSWKKLSKHIFLAGMPGSGKTNTMMHLVSEIHKAKIPVLVMEPAKKEYRSLTMNEGMEDLALFSPSANSLFPIHINPFEFPKNMKLADHINRLLDVFSGSFKLDPPFPMLLAEGIQNSYEKLGWLPGMINVGKLKYPKLSTLYKEIEVLFTKYKYAPDVQSNLQSVLQVRIGSLIKREMGDIFDVDESTYKPEEWLKRSAVIELASLGTGPSNFLMLMLMTLIREALDVEVYIPGEEGKPRHVIFLEEAHNLIANTTDQVGEGLDPKISATAFIVKMLAEVRALGEGIVIADQLPSAMAPEVVKNTSLKVALRLTSQDERMEIGTTMSADGFQMERMAQFEPGVCLVGFEGLLKPFEMRIKEFKGDQVLNDKQLIEKMVSNELYQENVSRSAGIMSKKFRDRMDDLLKAEKRFYERIEDEEAQKKEGFKKVLDKDYKDMMKVLRALRLETLLYITMQLVRTKTIDEQKDGWDAEVQNRTRKATQNFEQLIKKDIYIKLRDISDKIGQSYLEYGGTQEVYNVENYNTEVVKKIILDSVNYDNTEAKE